MVLMARSSACARNCIHTILCYPKKPETRGSPSPFTDGFTEGFVQSQEQVA